MSRAQFGSRALFSRLQSTVYLNHASVSPPSDVVHQAAVDALDQARRLGVDAFGPFMEHRERLREQMALMLGCSSGEVGFPAGTTRGIVDISQALTLDAGDEVICFEGEFPSNVLPWMEACRRAGATVTMLPLDGFDDGSGVGLARLQQAISTKTRLVAVSAVQFSTGLAMPLRQMGELARSAGAMLFVDGIQGLGGMPLDLSTTDLFVAGSHKWLMGLDGVAVAMVRDRVQRQLRPAAHGWLAVEEPLDFLFQPGLLRYNKAQTHEPRWMELGVQNQVAFAALAASVRLLMDLSPAKIHQHVQAFNDVLEEGLQGCGLRSLRAADVAMRSNLLCVDGTGLDLPKTMANLSAHQISVSSPDGRIRFAAHWPNDVGQIPQVVQAVRASLVHQRYSISCPS